MARHAAMYSASTVERATLFCFCACQVTAPPAIVNTVPETERRSSMEAPQSESQ